MNRTVETLWFALRFSATAVLLASCNGDAGLQGPSLPRAAATNLARSIAVRPSIAVHRDTRASWISPDVKRASRLLFVSDAGEEDVDIFSLPNLVLKGTITGFSEPQGMCSGTGGTVWVANTGTTQVFQLSRTGKFLSTIDDAYGYPAGCAVNPTNGDVVVFNIFGFNSGGGSAYIYSCPSCTPTELTIPNFSFGFGGYDPAGNLFITGGRSSSGAGVIGEIPAGKTSGFVIKLRGGAIEFPGFVGWYKPGEYLAAADQLCNGKTASCIYWVKISGMHGKIIGHTDLLDASGGQVCDMVQGVLDPGGDKNVSEAIITTVPPGQVL
ncbi:MAG: hypothetical protein WB810_13125 [Candidatus Cybelea sp.]